MDKIRRNIIALRKIRKLSRTELAEELNISYSALAKYENGHRNPDVKMLMDIADIFDVPMDQLLSRREYADEEPDMDADAPLRSSSGDYGSGSGTCDSDSGNGSRRSRHRRPAGLTVGENAFAYGALTDEERTLLLKYSQLDDEQKAFLDATFDQLLRTHK